VVKFFFILFFIQAASANVFSLKETSSRFTLTITKRELIYQSEAISKTVKARRCNAHLMKKLNGELLSMVPKASFQGGWPFTVNTKNISINPESSFGKKIAAMDLRIKAFLEMEKKKCH
jgi:hypothetical protein